MKNINDKNKKVNIKRLIYNQLKNKFKILFWFKI